MTDQQPDPAGLRLLDLSTIQLTSSLSLEQRIEQATRTLNEAVSPTFTPWNFPNTLTQSFPLRATIEWALKVADEAASSPTELTPIHAMTSSYTWPTPPDIIMRETMSGSLDLDDPHWTEMQQQQMLHEMRVPPQLDATLTQTSPINDIKNWLK